jgi:serine phosphatase RsbU (regulator of sigma subunit)
MLAVVVADLLVGPENVVLGLVVVGPVLAASLSGPRVTAGYAATAVLLAALLGLSDHQYGESERLVAQLVRLVGVAIGGVIAVVASHYRVERERRLLAVTRVAEAAQRAILLPVPDRVGPVALAVRYESAASEALVGGDLYGLVDTQFGLRIVVGDVRGKGLTAVRLSAQVLAAFRERANDSADLAVLMEHMHRAVERAAATGSSEDFVTAVLAQVVPDGRLTLALAGHPPPLLLRAEGLLPLTPPAVRPPLGLVGEATPYEVRLRAGDRVLLYTDGLTEARRPSDRQFLPDEAIASALSHPDAFQALGALREHVVSWSGGRLADDVAMVLADYRPDGPPEAR